MVKAFPLVTVITPYRNAASWLPGLVENLQKQTYDHWECLLVDHWSTDVGPDLLNHLVADDSRFRCFAVPGVRDLNCPQGGPSVPRNIALKKAAGELICFLDVDDLWHPCKLERQVRMHVGERLDLSVTAYYRWSWRTPVQLRWICPPRRLTAWSWRWGNPIPMLTVMVSREALRLLQQPNNALFESDRGDLLQTVTKTVFLVVGVKLVIVTLSDPLVVSLDYFWDDVKDDLFEEVHWVLFF